MIRPLNSLALSGITFTAVTCQPDGSLDPAAIHAAIKPETAMIALTHASNVLGALLPINRIGAIAREHDLLFLVDTASTAGCVPIDMQTDNIDLLAFTGHKALLGPTGTGGLIISPHIDPSMIKPVFQGGTGSRSASETQPPFLPDLLECGTINTTGLAGLGAALVWINETGVGHIQQTCRKQARFLLEQFMATEGVSVFGPVDTTMRTATISFTISNLSPSRAGQLLDERYGIMCRIGLHCAPRAHTTAGTFPEGTIRFSPGVFTTQDELAKAVHAVRSLAEEFSR